MAYQKIIGIQLDFFHNLDKIRESIIFIKKSCSTHCKMNTRKIEIAMGSLDYFIFIYRPLVTRLLASIHGHFRIIRIFQHHQVIFLFANAFFIDWSLCGTLQ